jgi:hypothetical protein
MDRESKGVSRPPALDTKSSKSRWIGHFLEPSAGIGQISVQQVYNKVVRVRELSPEQVGYDGQNLLQGSAPEA